MSTLKSERIEQALGDAVERGRHRELFEQLARASGLPGPRPNLDLARAAGAAIAAFGRRADPVVSALESAQDDYLGVVAVMALAARWVSGVATRDAAARLEGMAEDPRRHVREAVVTGLRDVVARRGTEAIDALASWMDGYLQSEAVLQALADRELLASVRAPDAVLARLSDAFALADAAPRSADRSQGLRALRRALPCAIVAFAERFPETLDWLKRQSSATSPETREVLEETARALRRSSIPSAEADRLAARLAASAPPPRDPTRIVHGTRRRGRGRS